MSKLMDRRKIREEYGVSMRIADKVFRDIARDGGVIRPDGVRRVFVRRVDVETLFDQWTS